MVDDTMAEHSKKDLDIIGLLASGWMILLAEDGNDTSMIALVFIGEDIIADTVRMWELCVTVSGNSAFSSILSLDPARA